MAIIDRQIIENKDIEKKSSSLPVEPDKKDGSDEVKNAHASGDGSFGRNDSSVPDEEAPAIKEDNSY